MKFKNNISLFRKTVQCIYAAFSVFAGWQFYCFYAWALRGGDYVPRPPAVEAFLPISALMSLKRLVLTGAWDTIHPAGLTFFIAVLMTALLFRRGFCGWVCPVGLLSDTAAKGGRLAHINLPVPRWLHYPLLMLKYLLLGFFAWIILWKMDAASIESFLQAPYNITVDARMLLFFLSPSGIVLAVMIGLVAVSFVIKHFWCTYLCPYGALLGIGALACLLHVKRDESVCRHCGRCEEACPAGIKIWGKQKITVPECIGCLECIAACPEDDCLELGVSGSSTRLPLWLLPAGIITVLLGSWLAALWTGHWHSIIPDETYRLFYNRFLPR